MNHDTKRLKAIAAALRGIRKRVEAEDDVDTWDTAAYDQWVGLLGAALDDDALVIEPLNEATLDRTEFLMHLDATIGFLEAYESEA